jgi:hypothetical protein
MLLLIACHTVPVRADSTDGKTPLALQPGAPAGSYALSELDNINPYNGSLNFRLPLLNVGGRGTAGYTMTLPMAHQHPSDLSLRIQRRGRWSATRTARFLSLLSHPELVVRY